MIDCACCSNTRKVVYEGEETACPVCEDYLGEIDMAKYNSWNKMSPDNEYTMTFMGKETKWEEKKKEAIDRGCTIIKEGSGKSSQGGPIKYWARVKLPDREG